MVGALDGAMVNRLGVAVGSTEGTTKMVGADVGRNTTYMNNK